MLVCTGIYLFIYLLFTQVSLSSDIVYLLRLQSCRYMSKQLPLYLYLLCVSEVLWVQVLHRPYIYWRISKNPYSVTALCYYSCHSSACLKRDSTFFFESRKWTSNFKMILKKGALTQQGEDRKDMKTFKRICWINEMEVEQLLGEWQRMLTRNNGCLWLS